MTKSILLQRLNHKSSLTPPTTSLARRALLLVSFLLIGLGNVWGLVLWEGNPSSDVKIEGNVFSTFTEGYGSNTIMRIYTSADGYLYMNYNDGGWDPILNENNIKTNDSKEQIAEGSGFFKGSYYELPMAIVFKDYPNNNNIFKNKGIWIQTKTIDNPYGTDENRLITKVEVLNIDPFAGELVGDNKDGESVSVNFGSKEKKLDFTEVLKKVPNATYVRIYVEKDGQVVDDPLSMLEVPDDMQYSNDNTSRGYYVFKEGGITAEYLDVTLKLDAAELDNYQVVTVWSTDSPELDADNKIIKEPDWDLQYTFSFEYPFKAETITETVTKEFTIKPKDWLQNFKVAFDYQANKIKLCTQWEDLSSVDIDESLWSSYSGGTLSGSFYVRWFLQDAKTGEEQYIEGALVDENGIYKVPEKPRYGLYWGSSKSSETNLATIMQMMVDYTKVDLSRYNLVCTIATDLNDMVYNNEALVLEPSTMNLKYVFKLVDTDWAGIENPQWTHTREVFVSNTNATAGKVTIPLAESYTRILTEYGVMGKELGESFHMRWYVTYKDDPIYSQSLLTPNQYVGYDYIGKLGVYWNSKTSGVANPLASEPKEFKETVSNLFNVDFTKPAEGDWSDYKVVVVMSRGLETQSPTGNPNELTHEPTELTMKYVFRFYTEGNFQFVHYQGESNRPYMTSETDNRIKDNGIQYYGWDRELGEPVKVDGAIRQGVHTVELEVYIDPNEGPRALPVPLQNYYLFASQQSGGGDLLEPAAYFRWYDWTTDLHNEKLGINGNMLDKKTDNQGDRGLFMLNCNIMKGLSPTFGNTGATYNPSGLISIDAVDYIACDVSKYFDGIYMGAQNPVLLHEPTLGMRYIFTIRPSSYIVDKIQGNVDEERGAKYFNAVKEQLSNGTKTYSEVRGSMFNLYEDKGRVVVSLGDNNKQFSVRVGLPTFGDYYITESQSCSQVQWYAYFEDSEGLWYNDQPLEKVSGSGDNRVSTFTLEKFKGNYKLLSSTSKSKIEFTPDYGSTVHVIGCVGKGSSEVEAIHYELQFINASAVVATDFYNEVKDLKTAAESAQATLDPAQAAINEAQATLDAAKVVYDAAKAAYDAMQGWDVDIYNAFASAQAAYNNAQTAYDNAQTAYDNAQTAYKTAVDKYMNKYKLTKDYLEENYNSQGVVNFDNYFADDSEPTNQFENMTYQPFEWDEAQYSFCYPNIDQFRLITTQNPDRSEWSGVTPIHGDYMILKSIKRPGVSENSTPPYDYHFYDYGDVELDDYTKTMGGGWGGMMYVDASDETRTIANLEFKADLCHGSHIYFVAAVADVTNNIAPQIMAKVYGIKGNGERVLVISFLTGILSTPGNKGKWFQVYGEGTIPEYINMTGIESYRVEIVNFSEHTNGADYCVDDICFYTSTAKVLLTHAGSSNCDDEGEETGETVLAYMEAEGLQNAFGVYDYPQPIYWRICEKGTKKPITGVGMYPQYKLVDGNVVWDNGDTDEVKRNTYGVTYVISNYNAEGVVITEAPDIPETYGWYKDDDGKYFFQITNKTFDALERGKNYYVSVYTAGFDIINNYHEEYWGSEDDPCSIYSEFFVPRRQYVTYIVDPVTGKEGGDLTIDCGSDGVEANGIRMILKVPYNDGISEGFKDYDVHFDYVISSMDNWNTTDVLLGEGTTYTYANLRDAWRDYRNKFSEYNRREGETGIAPDYANTVDEIDCRAVLEYALANKILILANSTTFTYSFGDEGKYPIICLPIEDKIYESEEDKIGKTVCAPFEVIFTVKKGDGPSLILGFEEVKSYPSGIRVIRIGKKQISNLQNNGYLLHIPVNLFKTDKDADDNAGALTITSSFLELLKYNPEANQANNNLTNDPSVPTAETSSEPINVATFVGNEISKTKMYIAVDFKKDALGITSPEVYNYLKEGFTYRMFFQVKDKDKVDDNTACEAGVEFLLKVVPEFVTWKGGNSEWNDDSNWSRSTRAELYKSADNAQNTGTEAQGGIYKDNAEINTKLTTNPGFVPMKFTYVTVPSVEEAPNLSKLKIDGTEGIYTQNTLNDDIRYDLMVRYTEEYCVTSGHQEYKNANIYDCEKFYGNWAKEIYFKPNAELVKQHYLTYGKVWVEKLLTANTWTLMSTPLQNTYAGDMYVPAVAIPDYSNNGTPVIGQQVTEAFQDITFGTGYSRTLYPIYQRSWAQAGSTVYTKTNDVRANSYSANIVTSTVGEKLTQWSHTYNDVQVPYSTWMGFAIRAHKKGNVPNALLRLPKEDDNYDYYQWDGTSQEPAAGNDVKKVTKATKGKLFTDGDVAPDSDNLTYGVDYGGTTPSTERTAGDGKVEVNIDDVQEANGYLLVGNPYLCSINMSKFLFDNRDVLDESGYWTYENNTVESELTGNYIKPLQSFFVKLKSDATNDNIVFNEGMMIDGINPPQTQPAPSLTMTASNERGQSSARVMVGDEAKRVETLLDSNLEDVPMVYTVADGQAVGINQLTTLDKPIAFGVTCMASDELVEVTFTDVAQLTTGEVTVVDAMTGEQTTISEGSVVSIQPNDYGRYYLLAGATSIGDKMDVQKGVMVRVRGNEVTVNSGEELTQVRALTLNGALTYQHMAGGNEASFMLSSGVYIIQAKNVAGEQQTVKVVIR